MRAAAQTSCGNGRGAAERGFTLMEVLIAIIVLVFGLVAITNLFVLATSSNVVARHMTAATTQATEAMEMLKAVPFAGLVPGGSIDVNTESANAYDEGVPMRVSAAKVVNTYAVDRLVRGVGRIRVRWQIVAVDNQTRLIRVSAASSSPVLLGRSRVDLMTYRSCTGPKLGCPAM
jgi:prepilin-type N-terminal cleavage/methylation domain-containing protein